MGRSKGGKRRRTDSQGHSKVTRALLGLRYGTPSWTTWISDALSISRSLHRKEQFDVVMFHSLPWHAHLAGYWVARELGIPWFANFNDPLSFARFASNPAQQAAYGPGLTERLWTRRILTRPEVITFPCSRLRDDILRAVPRKERTVVIPHIGSAISQSEIQTNLFTLVHAGKLGGNDLTSRSSDAFLEGLRRVIDKNTSARGGVKLLLVGPEDSATNAAISRLRLDDHIIRTGRVSYEESLKYIAQASVCVLIEGEVEEGVFLPSKLCDYLVAKKPVIALSPRRGRQMISLKKAVLFGWMQTIRKQFLAQSSSYMSRLVKGSCTNGRRLHVSLIASLVMRSQRNTAT
jgi:glycosyltransferase involved in cell wall biosynthesis